jgi:hypothetical protein
MLNEFVEKVIVHEGEGRGAGRRQRLDIYLNFIGAFEVPADIITPTEIEEQRLIQEENAARGKDAQARCRERYEKRKQDKREFTARKKAGLPLTPEETEADEKRREYRRAWQKEWRDKRKAALQEQSPKPLSQNEIIRRQKDGLPFTPEELAIYETWKKKRADQCREWRHNKKSAALPIWRRTNNGEADISL